MSNNRNNNRVNEAVPVEVVEEVIDKLQESEMPVEVEAVEAVTEEPVEVEIVDAVVEKPVIDYGVATVCNCGRLNVREQPNINSRVLCALDLDEEVKIELDQAKEPWVKVITSSGITGYCMQTYLAIRF